MDRQRAACELVALAEKLVFSGRRRSAASDAVIETARDIQRTRGMLYKHLKNFGLERDSHSRAALKALDDAAEEMMEIPSP